MKRKNQAIGVLINEFCDYLKKIHRSESTIRLYCQIWQRVRAYVSLHCIRFYNKTIGEKFLRSVLGNYEYSHLSKSQKNLVNRVEALAEFQATGTVLMGKANKMPPKTFEGAIGASISNYISYRKSIYGLSKITIQNYILYLHVLLVFLKNKGIYSVDQITGSNILLFIRSIDPSKIAAKHVALLILRNYLKYLYEQKLLAIDYSSVIPKDNYRKQPHLPSTFSKEEIGILLKSIDRGSPKGKRDYAIFLLATKLGLRSSDIRKLKFENILWERNLITFAQCKTGEKIVLPLLPEIGNAIIEYLKHGRPVSDESYCFLQVQSPYKQIDPSGIGNLVSFYLKRTGINCKNRKHGPHALRHSFAGNLLSEKIPISVISEALGHSNSESTMYYLRIDVTTLRQCALNVPLVPSSFYNQKGGPCYE